MSAVKHDYVVALALGPVQGFIASARRSRDLWAGSWILSELAKAAAAAWAQTGAQLVFPSVDDTQALTPGSELNVGNKLRAVLRGCDEAQVRDFVRRGADAARRRWCDLADQAWTALGNGGTAGLREDIWRRQRDDLVEVYGAWARIEGGMDGPGYAAATSAAERALAARKATRDFAPAALAANEAGLQVPKSSLDGARETVLHGQGQLSQGMRRRLGLARAEQLDVAGVVKRLTGRPEQFTPLTRVVADDWLQALSPPDRQALADAWEPLVASGLATRVQGNRERYADFAYDAGLCWRSRWPQVMAGAASDAERDDLQRLQSVLKPLWRRYGEPVPYGVLLQADGDRMGELLDAVPTLAGHVEITRQLSAFAQHVPDLVRRYRGHAIYAGGDDVLALVPLSQAIECAQTLAQAFAQSMREAAEALGLVDSQRTLPSLSVGLALVHVMEPLGVWRAHALAAEKYAKGDHEPQPRRRNALSVRLAIRAGHLVQVRWRWDEVCEGRSAVQWLQHWRSAFARQSRQLPSRLAYDLRDLARQAKRLGCSGGGATSAECDAWLQAEWKLLLQRARLPTGQPLPPDVCDDLQKRLTHWSQPTAASGEQRPVGEAAGASKLTAGGMEALAQELILARWLAARSSADLERGAA